MSFSTQIVQDLAQIDARAWNALLAAQPSPTPFMRAEYLTALHTSGSAVPPTGWAPHFCLLHANRKLVAACPVYVKNHSYGEYVFDWSWARAYAEHGLAYYPKAVIGVPFTPVPGSRLMARDAATRMLLLQTVQRWCADQALSSAHLLFGDRADLSACADQRWMPRRQVQFHWHNRHPEQHRPYIDFADFLAALNQKHRKKIRQEQRKVSDAGVTWRITTGPNMSREDWAFFYRCYEQTYLEHGNAPYLSAEFFARLAHDMSENWVMFTATRAGRDMACSLIVVDDVNALPARAAYGRYWGAIERVDCLHFDACYHQPIAWCIANGIQRFEGGAQGEHKLARALLPTWANSAHWVARPDFANAISHHLQDESARLEHYMELLQAHAPFRQNAG